jgi:hypothetical protein
LIFEKKKSFLSDKKFQKHLESLTDEERDELDFDDEESMQSEYDLFKSTETVREGLGKMWPSHMEDAFGIRLGKEGKAAVDTYLRKEMRENPEKIEEFAAKLETFRANREKIRALENELAAQQAEAAERGIDAGGHAKRAARHRDDERRATLWDKLRGRRAASRNAADDAEALRAHEERNKAAAEHAAELTVKLKEEVEKAHESGRDQVVKDLLQEEALAALVRDKVEKKLEKDLRIGGPKDFRAIEGASALGKKYREFAEETDAEAMDPDAVNEKLDDLAEKRARAEVKKAIQAVKVGYRFEKLQEKLDNFVNLNPIGTKEHEDARNFVMEVFDEEAERLDEEMKTEKKAILQRAMIGILKSKVAARFEGMEDEETA